MTNNKWRATFYKYLDGTDRTSRLGRVIDIALILLIAVNVTSVILETVESVHLPYKVLFDTIEFVSVMIFSIEYFLRLWVCVEDKEFKDSKFPRLRYALSPLALIDLIAILPFYLTVLFSIDLRFLRVLRLLRIFKLTRYSSALTMLLDVFKEEASAFYAGFFILGVLLILTASGAYLVEHEAQPDKFASIPSAMWWAVATLTTVGYGDVTPITPLGKFFGAIVTIVGIGMAALPAGILASGLADQLRRKREILGAQFRQALEDEVIDAEEEQELESLRKQLGLSERLAKEIRNDVHLNNPRSKKNHCPHCGKSLHD